MQLLQNKQNEGDARGISFYDFIFLQIYIYIPDKFCYTF